MTIRTDRLPLRWWRFVLTDCRYGDDDSCWQIAVTVMTIRADRLPLRWWRFVLTDCRYGDDDSCWQIAVKVMTIRADRLPLRWWRFVLTDCRYGDDYSCWQIAVTVITVREESAGKNRHHGYNNGNVPITSKAGIVYRPPSDVPSHFHRPLRDGIRGGRDPFRRCQPNRRQKGGDDTTSATLTL